MNELDALMSAVGVASSQNGEVQTTKKYKVNISKLMTICKMIMGGYPEIKRIYVSPASILLMDINDLNILMFTVVIDDEAENIHWVSEGNEVLRSFIEDEYPAVLKATKIETVKCSDQECNGSYVLLNDKDNSNPYSNMDLYTLYILNTMLSNGVPIALPNAWQHTQTKCVIILIEDATDTFGLMRHMSGSETMYGVRIEHSDSWNSIESWCYTPIISKDNIPYGLPYTIVTRDELEKQIMERKLKVESHTEHIKV